MSHAISSGDLGYQSSRAEHALQAILSFVFLVPVLIFRIAVMILFIRLVNFLLARIIAAHVKANLSSSDRKAIENNLKVLSDFIHPLKEYQTTLHRANLPWFFFSEGPTRKLDNYVQDFHDLKMAHEIFLEPVEREYPLYVEFRTLRRGRKALSSSYPPDSSELEEEVNSRGQIVLPNSLNT